MEPVTCWQVAEQTKVKETACYIGRGTSKATVERAGGHVRDPQETWGAFGEAVTGRYTHVLLAECRGQGKAERQTEMTTVSTRVMTVA